MKFATESNTKIASPLKRHLNRVIALITLSVFLLAACSPAQTPVPAPATESPAAAPATEAPAASPEAAKTPEAAAVATDVKPEIIKLKVGASPVPHAEILNFIKENLAEKAGLELTIVEFTDYVQPNLALNDGQIDANFFAHVPYQDDFGKEHKIEFANIAKVHIEPLGVYSKKIKSLSEIPDGAIVGIPNDATNSGRALRLFAENGLIKLSETAGINATVKDITDNPKKLQFKELEAAQLPRSLEDTTISVINGNYALEAKLVPSKDALVLEKGEGNPYANVLSVIKGHENDPGIVKLAKLLTSPEVKKFIEEKYQGSVIPAF